MAATIQDLYLKYVNKVSQSLEKDRYFRYLFEIVQAGNNSVQQTSQVLHKVVDERWLSTIEESLDAINTIIEKPRRFVTTSEEVVPVALAKKITADSVRHLSMNTQFITKNDDSDDIHPTHILNVTTEETYDLYENRFIYHLIQRLVTFIDKRTDVIFWSTGDETRNSVKINSKVDDAYEEIEYKLEMTVKNRQSMAENDSDNMQVFMRIDRVRRMVMALRNSAFCSIMAGCSKVRSPIQRTNLIMKDPHYRTCYKLWQFLESYDDVGYTIEERDTALQFDEEYLIQMYTNIITNYTVFKSLLEGDPRRLEELTAKQRKPLKPKFIKKIQEEIVDDYNIEDVEIRKVIIEEVTQAQLDAEAKLEKMTQRAEEAEAVGRELDEQLGIANRQVQTLMMSVTDATTRADLAEQEKTEMETAKAQAETALAEARQAMEAEKSQLEALRDEALRRAAEAEELLRAAEEAKAAAMAAAEEAERLKTEALERAESEAGARAAAEAEKAGAEEARNAAEAAQAAAVAAAAEAERIKTEALERAESEASARAAAEAEKAGAEEARNAAEAAQAAAVAAAAEAERVKSEALTRAEQEAEARAAAEAARLAAVEARESAEAEAARAEQAKAAAEKRAAADSLARESAEQAEREAAEQRASAEEARDAARKAMQEAEERAKAAAAERARAEEQMRQAVTDRQAAAEAAEAAEQAKREAEEAAARDSEARAAAEAERRAAEQAAAEAAEAAEQARLAREAAETAAQASDKAREAAEQERDKALTKLHGTTLAQRLFGVRRDK